MDEIALKFSKSDTVKPRLHHLKTYQKAFKGSKLVGAAALPCPALLNVV